MGTPATAQIADWAASLDARLVARLTRPLAEPALLYRMREARRILAAVDQMHARLSLAVELMGRHRGQSGYRERQVPIVHAVVVSPAPVAEARTDDLRRRVIESARAAVSPPRSPPTAALTSAGIIHARAPGIAVTNAAAPTAPAPAPIFTSLASRAAPRLPTTPGVPVILLPPAPRPVRAAIDSAVAALGAPTRAAAPVPRPVVTPTAPVAAPRGPAAHMIAHAERPSVAPIERDAARQPRPEMIHRSADAGNRAAAEPPTSRARAGSVADAPSTAASSGGSSPAARPDWRTPRPTPAAPPIDLDALTRQLHRRLVRALQDERIRKGYPR